LSGPARRAAFPASSAAAQTRRRGSRRDLGDHAALDAQDVELERPVLGIPGLAEVARGRRLPVGTRGHQEPVARRLWPENALEERCHRLAPLEQGRVRGHRDPDVVRDHRGRGRRVTALMGVDEALKQPALLFSQVLGGAREPLRGPQLLHRLPCPLERAVGRRHAHPQERGRFAGRHSSTSRRIRTALCLGQWVQVRV
jgi:hypothetical protein